MHGCKLVASQLELRLHEQTQIVTSAASSVHIQQFQREIASLLLISLLYISILTLFLNFYLFLGYIDY